MEYDDQSKKSEFGSVYTCNMEAAEGIASQKCYFCIILCSIILK